MLWAINHIHFFYRNYFNRGQCIKDIGCACGFINNGSSTAAFEVYKLLSSNAAAYDSLGCLSSNFLFFFWPCFCFVFVPVMLTEVVVVTGASEFCVWFKFLSHMAFLILCILISLLFSFCHLFPWLLYKQLIIFAAIALALLFKIIIHFTLLFQAPSFITVSCNITN